MLKMIPGNSDSTRIRIVAEGSEVDGPVAYWMSRDQRVHDNWALLFAQSLAMSKKSPLVIVFCLVPEFLGATARQYEFMLTGLEEVESTASSLNIPFILLIGNPEDELPRCVRTHRISALVTDFDPLRIKREWKDAVAGHANVPVYEVDAHNIVPCRYVSDKREYSAATIRRKITPLLPNYLVEFPEPEKQSRTLRTPLTPPDWESARRALAADTSVSPVTWLKSGETQALDMLYEFVSEKLPFYDTRRNDPNAHAISNLSPYLHFGQISAQRAALEVMGAPVNNQESADAFLEELIIRRELSDNYCWYTLHYDSLDVLPHWVQKTLNEHREDPRPYVYSREEFELAETHDPLWNAAQMEMVLLGKMHGYLRMYWAKKILEWSPDPESALETAVYLNDRYELDGRDPNGYAGIMWSIGGLHDRAWNERPVFGKIRYMNYNGCRRKFDVDAYIESMESLRRDTGTERT